MEKYNDYVSVSTALSLKNAGFNWEISTYYQGYTLNDATKHSIYQYGELITTPSCCDFNNKESYYNKHEDVSMHRASAPTLYVAQKWLREVKGIHITVYSCSQESWQYRITKRGEQLKDGIFCEDFYTYEEALEHAILTAIINNFLV